MKLLLLLQIFTATVQLCRTEEGPSTTIILNESQTEMTVEKVKTQDNPSNEFFENFSETEHDGNDLDFNYYDDGEVLKVGIQNPDTKEQEMQEVLLKAMKKPAIRKQIGEVIPILRVMSPAQRLTLAALVSSQITSQKTLSEENLIQMVVALSDKNRGNSDDRHNITEHLLLPISMDIAKMFKGLGKEVGRNLRESFYKPVDFTQLRNNLKKNIRKFNVKSEISLNRRMDEIDYDEFDKPVAEALKQPGKDECDYFTKSLCLEVTNYPTEAIISSLKESKDITNSFLTDFDAETIEENKQKSRNEYNAKTGHRLERRQDELNNAQEFASDGGGYMCPSSVKYARPKRARTTSGQWKYVVNAGEYTQTLRLEICQKPKSPCSFVTNHLNSQCTQIYNYHRLLTWEETKGLHMDIFKVPSCCSCHIQGYSTLFPPDKDFTVAEKRREHSEGTNYVKEVQSPPLYGYLGNKREISKQVSTYQNETSSIIDKNQSHFVHHKNIYQSPVDHLVPPGPPLPLDNEETFKLYSELGHPPISRVQQEPTKKYPIQADFRRATHKVGESTEPVKEVNMLLNPRIKTPVPFIPNKSNLKYPPDSNPFVENNPSFVVNNQVHFLKPSAKAPSPFPSRDITKKKPNPGVAAIVPDPIPVSKVNQNLAPQYFKSDFHDTKSLPSKISFSYASPPTKEIGSHLFTTPLPPQKSELFTSSGQKKINYNYHPIIDFFVSDSPKREQKFSNPQYIPLPSQDWIPVLKH